MTNSEYWAKRFEELAKQQFFKAEQSNADLKQVYAYTLKEIQKEVVAWYERYATENKMSLADARKQLDTEDLKAFRLTLKEYTKLAQDYDLPQAYRKMLDQASIRKRLDRSQMLYIDIVHYVEQLAKRQSDALQDLLKDVYEDSYYQAAYATQAMQGAYEPFAAVPKDAVDKAISRPWAEDGKDFSQRIWENKTKLINTLQSEITRTLMAAEGTTLLAGRIASRFNVSFENARRLAETETAYVQETARMDTWTKLGVKKYQLIAVLDNRTSPICRHMDGKIFDRQDAKVGVTQPPFHCYCRTTTVPYIKGITDDDTTRTARDPTTGKSVTVEGNLTYPEWKAKYVDKTNTVKSDIMTLPKANQAVIPEAKFSKYALNPEKAPDKAKVYELALGYTLKDTDALIRNIREHISEFPAVKKENNGYGDRYQVIMKLKGPNGKTANVLTAWIDDEKTGEMRLTSAYVTNKEG